MHNQDIYAHLKALTELDSFAMIKMAFTEKCSKNIKKCAVSSCIIPQLKFQGKDGYIDLRTIKESYSPTATGGSEVWKELYKLVKNNEQLEKLLSGLHFSVTTHLAAYHTNILGYYFSNPLLFKKRYGRDYKENFLHLYAIIRSAVANLSENNGEVPESAKRLAHRLQRIILKEKEMKMDTMSYHGISTDKKALLERKKIKDVENTENDLIAEDLDGKEDFMNSLLWIDKKEIEIVNEMAKELACLQCDKCKLWGTIQIKGIKSAIKALNGMPLFSNEVIYLINLFEKLSDTMVESKRLANIRFPQSYIFITCYKQILIVSITILGISLAYLRLQKKRKYKID
ncbi:Endoplasmic Reticulum [Glugoides intestinalis]